MNRKKNNDTLYLVLQEPWFSMEKDCIKKEEYRRICEYYIRRFVKDEGLQSWAIDEVNKNGFEISKDLKDALNDYLAKHNPFKRYHIANGMCSAERFPHRHAEFLEPKIHIGTGRPEWGAKECEIYFVITWGMKV